MRPLHLTPLLVPAALLAATPFLSPWGQMWTLIVGSFFVAKWGTWLRAVRRGARSTPVRHVGYLFTWPGMNATGFLDLTRRGTPVPAGEWAMALGKTALGGVLIWVVCPRIADQDDWLVGWTAVIGLGFLLFFGLFHLLSLAWRTIGADAPPQWRWPILATSVTDFWSNRWNRAFRRMSLDLFFRPLVRRLGGGAAMTVVFLISGLAHEVVLSLPAGAGFGMPTAYFLLQAAAMGLERARFARPMIRAGGPVGGWTRAFCLVGIPAWLLFHPPFLEAVILPGLETIGAG